MWSTKKLRSIAGVVLLLLAACGGGAGEDAGAEGADGATASSTVTMQDNAFAPSDPVILAGDELVNEGEAPHTFTVEGEVVDIQVDAGQTVTETIDLASGTYTLFCEFHRAQGMEGTLTVEV